LINLQLLNKKFLWISVFLLFLYDHPHIHSFDKKIIVKKKKKQQDGSLIFNLFLEKCLNIFRGRIGNSLKVKTESRIVSFFNNNQLIWSSLLRGASPKNDIITNNPYMDQGRSLNVIYYNQELYNSYGETIGNQDLTKALEVEKKNISGSSLTYNGIEINNTINWKEFNLLSGMGYFIRFSSVDKQKTSPKDVQLLKILQTLIKVLNFFSNLISFIIDWIAHQLNIGYNYHNPKDTLFSVEVGGIVKIIFVKHPIATSEVPEIFNIAQKIYFTTGLSFNFTWFETRLNLLEIKQNIEDYSSTKDYYKFNFYKPEWNFFSNMQIKFSFYFSGLKTKNIQTELVVFYPNAFDYVCRIMANTYQGKFIKSANTMNLSHGLKTLTM